LKPRGKSVGSGVLPEGSERCFRAAFNIAIISEDESLYSITQIGPVCSAVSMHPLSGIGLWAVHISDGVLAAPWWLGGFAVAALLALAAAWRIREEEVPKIALLTAAFFVASLLHVRVGPTSVHLLLNGLVGVVLGWRAGLAILVGLALQVALLGHGGFTTIGINSVILMLPALLAWQLFGALHRAKWLSRPWFRAALVGVGTSLWLLSLIFSVVLISTNPLSALDPEDPHLITTQAVSATLHPITLAGVLLLSILAAWIENRLENAPEFPLGLFVGEVAVLATTLLNCLVLIWGGQEDWHTLALLLFVAHLPIAVIEGIVLGFAVGFLARVKPEMLGRRTSIAEFDYTSPVAVSLNGHPLPVENPIPTPEKTK
jgi:cobalt/nickel transport system permease protein